MLAGLLKMCVSDREQELIRYAVVKSSGLSSTQAYKQLGFQNMDQRIGKVDNAIKHAKFIRESIDMLATIKDKVFLKSVGIIDRDTSSSEDDSEIQQLTTNAEIPEIFNFSTIAEECDFNWFAIDDQINGKTKQIDAQKLINDLKTTSANNKKKLQISYEAFLLDDEINSSHQERIASQMNGFIVTDSESDNPSVVHSVSSP